MLLRNKIIYKTTFFTILLFLCCTSSQKEKNNSPSEVNATSTNIVDVDSLYKRVSYNRSINSLESVVVDLKRIISIDPSSATHHYNIAEVYFELSKKKDTSANFPSLVKFHLEKSIEIDQEHVKANALMGELLLAYSKYQEAIKFFNRSLKIDYHQEQTHLLMGYAFKQLQEYEKAIDCFRNSVMVNPDFFEAHMQLGQIFHALEDSNALLHYNNALRLEPENDKLLYNKALYFQDMLDWNNALEAYAQLHRVKPFHSDGHYNLGFIHMELELYDIASNNFSDAIYSNSSFYQAYYARGICFETLGNISQAESDYNRAIELNPGYTYAIEALSDLKKKNKKYNK